MLAGRVSQREAGSPEQGSMIALAMGTPRSAILSLYPVEDRCLEEEDIESSMFQYVVSYQLPGKQLSHTA